MPTFQRIQDVAAPLAEALDAVQATRLRIPPVDILLSFTGSGLALRVTDRSAPHRPEIERLFAEAFLAAGWGVVPRYVGGDGSGGMSLTHPLGARQHS
ncbi:hypothetical protein [Streptomyces sp. NPDC001274]